MSINNVNVLQNSMQVSNANNALRSLSNNTRNSIEDSRLEQVAKDFETMFAKMLVDSMKKTVDKKIVYFLAIVLQKKSLMIC